MYRRTRQSGVSLIEVVITSFIVAILALTFWSVFRENFVISRRTQSSLVAQQELQILGRRFNAEVRAAAQSETGSYAIAAASSTEFSFFTDADNDGLNERIRYFVNGSSLVRGVLKPTGSPATYVAGNETTKAVISHLVASTTPVFQYYDTNYAGTSTALVAPVSVSNIRLVKFTLVVDDDVRFPPDPVVSTTQVSIRTLKDNL